MHRPSRGGALPAKPDQKMGHWRNPHSWFVDGSDKPRLRKMLKKASTKRRRQRDRLDG